ncbi:MAG: hypothetical protein Aurels2KO_02100 [Aureliella sp.]
MTEPSAADEFEASVLPSAAAAKQLKQTLQLVKELRHEQRNTETRRRVWSSYLHAIVIASVVPIPFLDMSSDYIVGYFAGCTTLVSVVHGLSMRPSLERWRLTIYFLIALLAFWTWINAELETVVDQYCTVGVFFLTAATLASIIGQRLSCGILQPDEPIDRTPRPSLAHIFGLTASYACLLAVSRWLVGDASALGGEMAFVGLVMVTLYAAACSTIGVVYWAFVSRWKGIPNACTGVLLLFIFQMLANVVLAVAMNTIRGQADDNTLTTSVAISLVCFCIAHILPIVAATNLLLLTGHRATTFERPEASTTIADFEQNVDPLS